MWGKQRVWCWDTDRENPVAPPQFTTQVSRPACQDEGDEDAFSILPANDVEAQACGALVQQHFPWLPAKESDGVRVKGRTETI